MKKHKTMSRLLSWLLISVMTLTMLPIQGFAFDVRQEAANVKGGMFTTADGTEYAVLYNDYITLYVNTLDGGFAVLPATENFDSAKLLSHATFRIDGDTYRYGTYYSGMSGAVSIAPQVDEDNILESHWQIGDFVISQVFAITSDTEHDNSYAVKIGYAAQYFGEGSANIAGRILLDTQFTPDESVPVMLLDGADNLALVESEAEMRPVPSTALISKEFIEEANEAAKLEAELEADPEEANEETKLNAKLEAKSGEAGPDPVYYTDSPNKGYLLFDDSAFTTPNSVVFAEFGRANSARFEYAPDWEHKLFDGSGADSAALLYWDEISVSSGNQAAFGTNYGFYDLERGNPRFDPLPEPAAMSPMSAGISALATEAETTGLQIYPIQYLDAYTNGLPTEWLDISVSVPVTSDFAGTVAYGDTLTIQAIYKPDTPDVIREAFPAYRATAKWGENGPQLIQRSSDIVDGSDLPETDTHNDFTLELGEYYWGLRQSDEDLIITLQAADAVYSFPGYSLLEIRPGAFTDSVGASVSEDAAITLTGQNDNDVIFMGNERYERYDIPRASYYYLVKQDAALTMDCETKGPNHRPRAEYPMFYYTNQTDTGTTNYTPDISAVITPVGTGPITYSYTFTVPSGAVKSQIEFFVEDLGTDSPVWPINVMVFDSTGKRDFGSEYSLYNAVGSDAEKSQGMLWAEEQSTVEVNTNVLSSGTLKVYNGGTKTSVSTTGISGGESFTMPSGPVDIVYEIGTPYRVFTEVTNGGSAVVTVNPAQPLPSDEVYIYVTNIEAGYNINGVTADNSITPALVPGGAYKFTMPSNADVTVTVELESDAAMTAAMHNVTVKPMAGEGMVRYDAAFWTDSGATGARSVYAADEFGRLGKIREGATVYYAVYPYCWEKNTGAIQDMQDWVVDGFTIDGNTPSGFEGINTGSGGHNDIGYFPYTYSPSSANATAGSFTMPSGDVEIEITGYKKTRVNTLTLEAYDTAGNRLYIPENLIRSQAIDPADTTVAADWTNGVNVSAFMDEYLRLEAPYLYDIYTLQSAEILVGGRSVIPLEPYNYLQGGWGSSGGSTRYYFQPMYQNNAVIRLTYDAHWYRLNVTGQEPASNGVWAAGAVEVYAESNNGEGRVFDILPGPDGKGEILLTLHWQPYLENFGYIYELEAGTSTAVTRVSISDNYAVYRVTVSGNNASATVKQTPVARTIPFSGSYFEFNSPNSYNFKTVMLSAGNLASSTTPGEYGMDINLRDYLSGSGHPAPRVTKMTLSGEKGGASVASWTATAANMFTDPAYQSAFSYPEKNWGMDFSDYHNGQLMDVDLRAIFGLADNYAFPEGDYTFTIEWAYGENWEKTGTWGRTTYLSPNAYTYGELTHIGIVRVDKLSSSELQSHKAHESNGGAGMLYSWVAVSGGSEARMLEKAAVFSSEPPLLTFVCENGFDVNEAEGSNGKDPSKVHDYRVVAYTVVMNGHAYFKRVAGSFGSFYIDENKDGSVSISSYRMSLGNKNIPFWLPVQIGPDQGIKFGTNTLEIELLKNQTYEIPERYPIYGIDINDREEWEAAMDEIRAETVVIEPAVGKEFVKGGSVADVDVGLEWTGSSVTITIGEYEMTGLTASTREIYLLDHGFDIGGLVNVQIPNTTRPIFRVELVSLLTDNTAKLIPVDQVWAEGMGTVRLPDILGGVGGQAEGVINTYTQDFGFEGEVNFVVVEFGGAFYLKRSINLKIPVLDRFEIMFGADGLAIGLGLPPAPAQVIEIQQVSGGIENIAATLDYNLGKGDLIPPLRIKVGARFKLIEVLGFGGQMWSEMFSGGISVDGGIDIGPLSLSIIKEVSMEAGMRDGPFVEYEDQGAIVKGKRSLLFFINAKMHVSLFGFVDGAGAFGINFTISPFLWEKQGGFSSYQELMEFMGGNLTAWGYVFCTVQVLDGDWTIAEADVRIDIVFAPGPDPKYSPFGFTKFEFVAAQYLFGEKVGEDRFNLLSYYSALQDWVKKEVEKKKQQMSGKSAAAGVMTLSALDYAESQLNVLSEFLASPEASGLSVDSNYTGEHRDLAFGDVVADSERTAAPSARSGAGLRALSIVQDTANISVYSDGASYTHTVNVPGDGNGYVLRMEGYGGDALTFGDLRVFKPNGQALTIREISGEVTAAQAGFGYNAAVMDGVLMLSLADFMNEDGSKKVTGVGDTLPGVWQIVCDRPFKSSLVKLNAVPGVKSVELSGSALTAEFENVTGSDYYYDISLERKGDSAAAPLESLTLVSNKPYTATATLDLTSIPYGEENETYDIAEVAASGDWYPRVTLRKGETRTFTDLDGASGDMLITEYVDDKIGSDPYTVVNTALSGVSWTANLSAASGGNQSIAVAFDSADATAPADMTVTGYHATVYDQNGAPAGYTVTDSDGKQSYRVMEYDILTPSTLPQRYEYRIPNVPMGDYTVGVSAMYADLIAETDENGSPTEEFVASAVSRKGPEVKSGAINIPEPHPPVLTMSVTDGSIVTTPEGSKMIFAGENAVLTAAASPSGTVTFSRYDGAPEDFSVNKLADYVGEVLIVAAENADGDTTVEFVTVYDGAAAPLLLPDNYDPATPGFVFTAYNDTGAYTITGQTDAGASIGGTVAAGDGKFAITGNLAAGVDDESLTLSVSNAAGMVTMREVNIVRGSQNTPVTPPSGNGGGGGGTTTPVSGTHGYIITTPEGKPAVTSTSGTITLPGGGTIKTPEGLTVTAPEGTTVDKGGLISIPSGKEAGISLPGNDAQISISGGTTINRAGLTSVPASGSAKIVTADGTLITAPGGTTIALNGTVTPPRTAAASVTLSSGLALNIREGTVIILDENVPLGYRAVFENPFADVKAGAWFFDDVGFAYTHGLFAGTGATSFSPNTSMTRGMIVTVLGRLHGIDTSEFTGSTFSDVDAAAYYAAYVEWARTVGVVSGVGNNNFAPDAPITRQDLAVILYNYIRFADKDLPKKREYEKFADDAYIAPYAREAVDALYRSGVISGKPGNLFDPQGTATRAEVAAMLHRFIIAAGE